MSQDECCPRFLDEALDATPGVGATWIDGEVALNRW